MVAMLKADRREKGLKHKMYYEVFTMILMQNVDSLDQRRWKEISGV